MVSELHIERSIRKALSGESNLTESQLSVRGFSTPTMRHLFNNICNFKNAKYLEVGLYCGGTFCSSFNKDTISVGIEDFSQDFGVETVEPELKKNIQDNLDKAKAIKLIEGDCFMKDILNEKYKFDVLFYDAEHSEENQAKALPFFLDKMADKFIYIIDDTNWPQVSAGVKTGIESLGDKIEIEHEWNLVGKSLNDDPIWHNGVKIYLIRKK